MARKNTARKSRSKSARKSPANSRKRGRGRPSDFKPEFCEQAEKLCKLLNADDAAIAGFFGKDVATINRWKTKHPEFCASIKRGKLPADTEIAAKLHERACGYEWIEQTPIKLKTVIYGDNGKRLKEEERVEVVSVLKRQPPDVTAQIFWLKNRQPDTWRDKHEMSHGGHVDVNINEVRGAIASKLDRIADAIAKASVSR